MSSQQTALGAAAQDRKARLAKLKSLKRKQPGDEIVPPALSRDGSAPPPSPLLSPLPRRTISEEHAPPQADGQADQPPAPHQHKRHAEQEEEEEEGAKSDEKDPTRHLSLRTYDPSVRGPKLGFDLPPTASASVTTLEAQARQLETDVRENEQRRKKQNSTAGAAGENIDIFDLRPRKLNWDLKRDLEAKLDVLNVRTQNAINTFVRERIAAAATKGKKTCGKEGKSGEGDGEMAVLMHGAALVEGLKVREKEDQEEELRYRERQGDRDMLG